MADILIMASFQVNTHTDRSEFQFGSFSVVRRYSDFVWLATKLGQAFPVSVWSIPFQGV